MAIPFPILRRLRAGLWMAALLSLLVNGCTDETTGPTGGWPAQLTVQPVLAPGAGSFALWVDQVRLQVIREPDEVLADTILSRSPDSEELQLQLQVLITPPSEELLIRIEFLSSSTVLFEGERSMVVRPSPATNASPEIPLTYVGPGSQAQSLAVEPGDSALTFGGSVRMRVEALDGQGNVVDPVYVSWSVSDARLSIDAAGVLQAPSSRLTAVVTARTPTGLQGTATLNVVPPLDELEKISEDGYEAQVGAPVPLAVRVLGTDALGVPAIPVTFVSTSGGGSVQPSMVYTDSDGLASASAMLGSEPGPQVFEARAGELSPISFSFMAVPRPAIALDHSSVELELTDLSEGPVTDEISVTNGGGGNLTGLSTSIEYTTGQPTGWLTASLEASAAPTTLTLTATRGSLSPGTYGATVGVASPVASNSPRTVSVTLQVVQAPPHIVASPTVVKWQALETSTSISPSNVQITNGGGGTLSGLGVTVTSGSGQPAWLAASLSSATAPTTLTLTPEIPLPPGVYTADVAVSAGDADNSPLVIEATMTVAAVPPHITVAPPQIDWTWQVGAAGPATSYLSITNSGGGTLSGLQVAILYDPESPHWLSANLSSTTAPATLSLTPSPETPTGKHSATVLVYSSVADNSPFSIPATIDVYNRPVVSSAGYNELIRNDSESCAAQSPPGSSYRFYFDYGDSDGDIPVTFGEIRTLYGEPIRMQYQFLPAGNSGVSRANGDVDGDNVSGTAWFDPCIQFGPAANTSVTITISIFDLGGHESNRLSFNIPRPVGANVPPAGVPGAVGKSGG